MNVEIIIKLHAILAIISIFVYVIRGGMMLTGAASANSKPMLMAAMLSMVLLLITGIASVFFINIPFTSSFVILKTIGLVLYVVLGMAALKPNMPKVASIALWLLGLAAFAYSFLMAKGMVAPLF